MNRNNFFKKGLVFIIIALFAFISINPFTHVVSKNIDDISSFNDKIKNNNLEDNISVTCYIFQRGSIKKCEVVMSSFDVNELYDLFVDLKHRILKHPFDDQTQIVKEQFIVQLGKQGLIPREIPSSKYNSLLNPSWFLGIKGDGVNYNKIPYSDDVNGSFAKAFLCSWASEGSGWIVPPIMIPRPRLFNGWVTFSGLTSVAELYSLRGFVALGFQIGLSLGSVGVGLSFAFPGVPPVYGFIGYALFTTVFAESIARYPPNNKPEISQEQPSNGALDIPTTLSELSFRIEDGDGDLMDYSVTTFPNIGSGSGNNKLDGVYSISVSGLDSLTKYSWKVVVFDGEDTVEKTFSFTTGADAPVVSDPVPSDGKKEVPLSLSSLSFALKDFQGDLMDYTVETSPDIGSGGGSGVGDGTYTCDVGGLDYSSEYFWFVNVTDGVHWARKVFSFQTEMIMVFDPFEEGWHYRKSVTVDHSMVAGDLVDFPVLVSVVDLDLRDKAQFDGDDVLFMDGVGVASRLFHEIEFFDGSSGELVVWVNVPSLSSVQDTEFYLYYGNPSCSSQQFVEKVWNSDYVTVLHMSDNTNSIISDSTSYGNNGNKRALNEPIEQSTGMVYESQNFDGAISGGDYIIIPYNSILSSDNQTVECWSKPDTNPPYNDVKGLICKAVDTSDNREFMLVLSGYWDAGNGYTEGDIGNSIVIKAVKDVTDSSAGVWKYSVLRKTRGTTYDTLDLFANGNLKNTTTVPDHGYKGTASVDMGRVSTHSDNTRYFDGNLDEVRISKIARNNSWINTTYNTISSPSSFLSVGLEESPP